MLNVNDVVEDLLEEEEERVEEFVKVGNVPREVLNP